MVMEVVKIIQERHGSGRCEQIGGVYLDEYSDVL